ncbi:MAG: CoA ester lyase [Anaerolineae bacterium]|nr:CoA ester lyase [Anaerolineae bacterium]
MSLERPKRSMLFVPGLRPDRLGKAAASGADLVCIDLEDAVPPGRKGEARALAMEALTPSGVRRTPLVLRVNGLCSVEGLRDVLALVDTGAIPDVIMLPKVRSAEEVRWANELLRHGPLARIPLLVIIETIEALENAATIARAHPRVRALVFGGADLAAELGASMRWEVLLFARSKVIVAAAGAGIDAFDVPCLDVRDAEGCRDEAERALAMGFTGKVAIHPDQVAPINAVFTPDRASVEKARAIVAAFESDPDGLLVMDGKLIEAPVIRAQRRILAIAAATGL